MKRVFGWLAHLGKAHYRADLDYVRTEVQAFSPADLESLSHRMYVVRNNAQSFHHEEEKHSRQMFVEIMECPKCKRRFMAPEDKTWDGEIWDYTRDRESSAIRVVWEGEV